MHQYDGMRVRRLPCDDDGCGWSALLPALPPPRTLSGGQRADVAIIGAGFTGLAAARRWATLRPQARVAVLDAQRVGAGASGRNSGFIVDLPHYVPAIGTFLTTRPVPFVHVRYEDLVAEPEKHFDAVARTRAV